MNYPVNDLDERRMKIAVAELTDERIAALNKSFEEGRLSPFALDTSLSFTSIMKQIVDQQTVWGYTALAGFYATTSDTDDQVYNESIVFMVDYNLISIEDGTNGFTIRPAAEVGEGIRCLTLTLTHLNADQAPQEVLYPERQDLWSAMFEAYAERYQLDNPFFRAGASMMCHVHADNVMRYSAPVWNDAGCLELDAYFVWPSGNCAKVKMVIDIEASNKAMFDFIDRAKIELANLAQHADQD